MTRIVRAIAAFVRWLLATERLSDPTFEAGDAERRRRGFARWVFARSPLPEPTSRTPVEPVSHGFFAWLVSADVLSTSNDNGKRPHRQPGWLIQLLESETLPRADTAHIHSTAKPGFLRRLSAAETCPEVRDAIPHHRRSGFFTWLFLPEDCPVDETGTAQRHTGFFGWLLAGESL